MEQLLVIKKFLLETIWGILILGASGSILGGIIIYIVKKVTVFVNSHKENIFYTVTHRYYRQIEIGKKFIKHQNPSKDSGYIVYCIGEWFYLSVLSFALISVLIMGALILLFFGLERPYLLSSSVSLALLLLNSFIKQGMFCTSMYDEEVDKVYEDIESKQPNGYKEWANSVGSSDSMLIKNEIVEVNFSSDLVKPFNDNNILKELVKARKALEIEDHVVHVRDNEMLISNTFVILINGKQVAHQTVNDVTKFKEQLVEEFANQLNENLELIKYYSATNT